MFHSIPILHSGQEIGKGSITQIGLYSYFDCRFCGEKNRKYRLYVSGSEDRIDLGIGVPEGEDYTVRKSVASKLLEDDLTLYVVESINGSFFEISENDPFPFVEHLERGVFEMQNNKPGIRFREQIE